MHFLWLPAGIIILPTQTTHYKGKPPQHSFSFALLIPATMDGISQTPCPAISGWQLEFFVKFCQSRGLTTSFGISFSCQARAFSSISSLSKKMQETLIKSSEPFDPHISLKIQERLPFIWIRSSKSQNRSKNSVYHPPSNSHKWRSIGIFYQKKEKWKKGDCYWVLRGSSGQ